MRKTAFQISKIVYLWVNCFVGPSLNVITETNIGFVPFLILCRNIEKYVVTKKYYVLVYLCRDRQFLVKSEFRENLVAT